MGYLLLPIYMSKLPIKVSTLHLLLVTTTPIFSNFGTPTISAEQHHKSTTVQESYSHVYAVTYLLTTVIS